MKITSVDIWEVIVPSLPGTVNSPEFGLADFSSVPCPIIRLNTDEGITGAGECGRGTPRASVEELARRVTGWEPLRLNLRYLPFAEPHAPAQYPSWREWEWGGSPYGNPAAHAFEMALLDLLGKKLGVPAHFFLGGAFRTRVPADYWIGSQNAADAYRNAKKAADRGFHGLKMKCTADDPWEERMQAILDAAGPEFKVTIDPNTRFYRLPDFLDVARRLERFPNVAVYEDPMPKWNLDWYREARARVKVPIALHLGNPYDITTAVKAQACDCVNLGGTMFQFVHNASVAEAAGMLCWHGSGNDLGIMEHSHLHAAAATRSCVIPSDFVGSWTREDDLVKEPIRFEGGCALVPDKPGLGCELDLAAIEKYRVR